MYATILRIHRFLASQALYPLLLSTLLALGFYGGRVLYGQTWNYSSLVWNLFLAWVPFAFSFIAALLHIFFSRQWWLLLAPGALWLIFFPNAPYIVTDFLHLTPRPPIPLWYDIGLLATFAWTGCFLAIASLRTMQYLVEYHLGKVLGWMFVGVSLVMSGLGIYLGRFGRWNSWDLFFQPGDIILDVLVRLTNPMNNLRFFAFTIMFTTFLGVCYLMFISITRLDENEKIDQNEKRQRQV
jgi:uncharacterized membrane protein